MTLSRAGHPRSRALIRRALGDGDRDVVGAGVRAAGGLGSPWAVEVLLDVLRRDLYPRSRVAAQLERMTPMIGPQLVPLLDDATPEARFWAATLLGDCPGVGGSELVDLTRDGDPNIRAAAVEALGRRRERGPLAAVCARLDDPTWFVRVHACRAVAELGTVDDARGLTPALRDPRWWVRTAAKDALRGFGLEVAGVLIPLLDDDDRFARNGAAEVLQDIGFVDALAARGDNSELLERIYAAGGPALREAARVRADFPEARRGAA
jgi:HEAT repeat protein